MVHEPLLMDAPLADAGSRLNRLRAFLVRHQAWTLTAVVAVLYLATAHHAPLGSSIRYPEAAREMLERGEWVVPLLGHVPYAEKPILVYWLGMLAQAAFGTGDLATQLPAGVSILVAVLATAALARRLRGDVFGLVAGVVLATSGLVLVMASTLTADPPLMAALAVAWWCLDALEREGRATWRWGFWIALGVGFLAKGPVALALPGCAWVGYACLRGGTWRERAAHAWALGPLGGLLVVVAISLPWTVLLWRADPRLVEFFYLRVNLGGFLDGQVNHPGAWWYYVPVVFLALMPAGMAIAPAAAVGTWRAVVPRLAGLVRPLPAAGDPRLLLACMAVFPLLFLSVNGSKLGTYCLPVLPALVVLGLDALWERPRWAGAVAGRALLALGGLACIGLAAVCAITAGSDWVLLWPLVRTIAKEGIDLHGSLPWVVAGIGAFGAAAIVAGLLARRQRWPGCFAALGGGTICAAAVLLGGFGRIIPDRDGSDLVRIIRARGAADDLVVIQSALIQDYGLMWDLGRRAVLLGELKELGMGHFVEVRGRDVPLPPTAYGMSWDTLPDHPWLTSTDRLIADWKGPRRFWILCRKDTWDIFHGYVLMHTVARSGRVLLVSNQP